MSLPLFVIILKIFFFFFIKTKETINVFCVIILHRRLYVLQQKNFLLLLCCYEVLSHCFVTNKSLYKFDMLSHTAATKVFNIARILFGFYFFFAHKVFVEKGINKKKKKICNLVLLVIVLNEILVYIELKSSYWS